MEPEVVTDYEETLLIEVFAAKLGFNRLSDLLPGTIYPPYLLVAATLFVEYGVVDGYNYFIADKSSIAEDPLAVIVGFGLILAVAGIRWMRDNYAEAIASLRVSERDGPEDGTGDQPISNHFEEIVPFRIKLLAYVGGLILLYINVFVLLGVPTLLEIEGTFGTVVINFILQPLVYVPLLVEFALLYVGIHVLVPRRIAKADLDLFFYDPRNMGGFAKVGQLLKRSYYLFTVGLLLYFTLIYGSVILDQLIPTPYPEPTAAITVMFTLLWILGVASIAYSMYRIHTVMAAKKERRIEEIEAELRELLDDPYDINQAHLANHDKKDEIQHRLEQVRSTREYPSTFTMWTQIGISVILPQALNLVVQVVP